MKTSRKHSIAVGVCLLTAAATALPLSSAAGATAALPAAGGATTALPGLGDAVDTLARTLDTRAVDRPVLPTAAARNALTTLLSRSGAGTRATWDERFGTLRSLRGPRPLTAPTTGSAVSIARSWVRANAAAFGLTAAQVDGLAVVRDHTLPGTGTHVVDLVQTAAGVPAARGGRLNIAVTQDGRVLSYAGDPTPGAGLTGGWALGETGALLKVAGVLAPGIAYAPKADGKQAGYTTFGRGPFGGPSYVKKVTFGTRAGSVAAYKVYFLKSSEQAWEAVVDGTTGRILYRASVVAARAGPAGHGVRQLPRGGPGRHRAPAVVRPDGASPPRAGSTRPG